MLLVYGAVQIPVRITPAITKSQRVEAIEKAMGEVTKEHALRKRKLGLRNSGDRGN